MIKFFLSLLLGALAIYALVQQAQSRLVSRLLLVAVLTGGFLVWAPEYANRLASLMGVGRGADLLLYCFTVATLILIFNLHLRLQALQRQLTKIARHVALEEAENGKR